MATFNHKIQVANGNGTDTYHPETNTEQVYDYINAKWLSSTIGTLNALTTTAKTSLVASLNELAATKANATSLTTHTSSIATTSQLGHVRPDGVTITINSSGVITAVGGGGGGSGTVEGHVHTTSQIISLDATLAEKAPLVSPSFTGTPVAPTATVGTNTTQLATTAFVTTAIANVPDASATTKGVVQLNNTLTSTSTALALTAAQGKALNDSLVSHTGNANIHVTATNKSDWDAKETTTGSQAKVNTHASVVATTSQLGHVKPDGVTITIDGNGVIKAVGGGSGGSGTVTKVNNVLPDGSGNVILNAQHVSATPADHLLDTTKKHIEVVDTIPANLVGKSIFFAKSNGSNPDIPTDGSVVESTTLKVLMIGNSYSEDVSNHIHNIAKSAGINVIFGDLYRPGETLEGHWAQIQSNANGYTYYERSNVDGVLNKTTTNNMSLKAILTAEAWDIVTYQQGSPLSGQYNTFQPYLQNIMNFVNTNKTNPNLKHALHMTWAYSETTGASGFVNYGRNQMTMYNAIASAYQQAMQSTDIDIIIPTGTAIQIARLIPQLKSIDNDLLDDDLHLGDLGDYIGGLTIFETLLADKYKKSLITDVSYTVRSKFLSRLAKIAVKNAVLNPFSMKLIPGVITETPPTDPVDPVDPVDPSEGEFYDDFSNPNFSENWISPIGSFGNGGGYASATSNQRNMAVTKQELLADNVSISTNVKLEISDSLVFRFKDADNFHLAHFETQNRLVISRQDAGTRTILNSISLPSTLTDRADVRVELRGSEISVFINNILRLTATSSQFLTEGQHGIFSWTDANNPGKFYSFEVKAL